MSDRIRIVFVCLIGIISLIFLDLSGSETESFDCTQFRSFNDLIAVQGEPLWIDLEEAVDRALTANLALENQVNQLQNSKLQLAQKRSEFQFKVTPSGKSGYVGGGLAGQGLSVGGGVDLTKKFSRGTHLSVSPEIIKANDTYYANFKTVLKQPIFKGYGKEVNLSSVRAARFEYHSKERGLYTAEVELVEKTIKGVYEILKQEKLLAMNFESYKRLEGFYRSSVMKEKLGFADPLDVYRAQLQLKSAQDNANESYVRWRDAQDALKELLNLPMDQRIAVTAPFDYEPIEFDEDEAVEIAWHNRIEIDQAVAQVSESKRISRVSKNNLLPSINLVVNYSACGKDQYFTKSCTFKRESAWGVGITSSSPLNRVAEWYSYEQSRLGILRAQRGIHQKKEQIALTVRRKVRLLKKTFERIKIQRERETMARNEMKLAQIKYNHCIANNFDLIQAEKTWVQAKQKLITAVVEHIVGEYETLAALGILLDKSIIGC